MKHFTFDQLLSMAYRGEVALLPYQERKQHDGVCYRSPVGVHYSPAGVVVAFQLKPKMENDK